MRTTTYTMFNTLDNGTRKLIVLPRYFPLAAWVRKIVYTHVVGMRRYYVFRMSDGRYFTLGKDN